MKIVLVFVLSILLLTSCADRYQFWNISKFNIVDTALKDNEEIKLFYSSRGPDNNEDLKYYIHIIVISQKTGDTVNILTPIENGFSIDDKDKVFNYFDQNNLATKYYLNGLEKIEDINSLNEASKNAPKKITQVVRDTKFDYIADNNYPTVIGTIGTTTK